MAESEIPVEISEEEFSRWLTPLQTYELLKGQWTYEVIYSTLRRLLGHGMLLARAGTLKIRPASTQPNRTLHRALVVDSLWEDSPAPNTSHFWENGIIDFEEGRGYGATEYSCFDVRFDPDAILALLKTEAKFTAAPATNQPEMDAVTKGRKTRHGLPGLHDDLLQSWYELFLRAYPKGSKGLAEESARGMFPDHSVDRRKVRELYGPGTKGRPLKNTDK